MIASSHRAYFLLFVSILLTPVLTNGQGVLSISTDKSEYALGEPIQIHIVISNPTTEAFTLEGSTTCQAWFRVDDFDAARHSFCTADLLEIHYPPGAERNYYFTVDPAVLGLPASDGAHNVVGYWAEMADSTTISAPMYPGGRVTVGFESTTSLNDVAALKDSLSASVVESYESGNGITETWEIFGMTIDSAEVAYGSDTRFRFFEAYRIVPNHTIISSEEIETPRDRTVALSVFPNPCHQRCTIQLTPAASGLSTISVVDGLGRTVSIVGQRRVSAGQVNSFTITRPNSASGLYFVVARSANSVTGTPVLFVN